MEKRSGGGLIKPAVALKQYAHKHGSAIVASVQETGYHAPSRWPASEFKHGKQQVFINLEEFKWH